MSLSKGSVSIAELPLFYCHLRSFNIYWRTKTYIYIGGIKNSIYIEGIKKWTPTRNKIMYWGIACPELQ
jgi:hypothetical protein